MKRMWLFISAISFVVGLSGCAGSSHRIRMNASVHGATDSDARSAPMNKPLSHDDMSTHARGEKGVLSPTLYEPLPPDFPRIGLINSAPPAFIPPNQQLIWEEYHKYLVQSGEMNAQTVSGNFPSEWFIDEKAVGDADSIPYDDYRTYWPEFYYTYYYTYYYYDYFPYFPDYYYGWWEPGWREYHYAHIYYPPPYSFGGSVSIVYGWWDYPYYWWGWPYYGRFHHLPPPPRGEEDRPGTEEESKRRPRPFISERAPAPRIPSFPPSSDSNEALPYSARRDTHTKTERASIPSRGREQARSNSNLESFIAPRIDDPVLFGGYRNEPNRPTNPLQRGNTSFTLQTTRNISEQANQPASNSDRSPISSQPQSNLIGSNLQPGTYVLDRRASTQTKMIRVLSDHTSARDNTTGIRFDSMETFVVSPPRSENQRSEITQSPEPTPPNNHSNSGVLRNELPSSYTPSVRIEPKKPRTMPQSSVQRQAMIETRVTTPSVSSSRSYDDSSSTDFTPSRTIRDSETSSVRTHTSIEPVRSSENQSRTPSSSSSMSSSSSRSAPRK